VAGKKANALDGVSCTNSTTCTAVGSAQANYGSGERVTVGVRYK